MLLQPCFHLLLWSTGIHKNPIPNFDPQGLQRGLVRTSGGHADSRAAGGRGTGGDNGGGARRNLHTAKKKGGERTQQIKTRLSQTVQL